MSWLLSLKCDDKSENGTEDPDLAVCSGDCNLGVVEGEWKGESDGVRENEETEVEREGDGEGLDIRERSKLISCSRTDSSCSSYMSIN